ncbi:MAG: bifunctional folylpolyglutamate synthase/dihydrofolate synthase [Lachnospiraceae bacterium]
MENKNLNDRFVISHLSNSSWKISRLGIERIRDLLERLGNPQNELKFVHIGGTNGKGSVAAMLSTVFVEAGYKTGLFISPYVHRFNERIQINGQLISDSALLSLITDIRVFASQSREQPTEFEQITAAAFRYFAQQQCDIVVLEVGMGGRLDATNVISKPEAVVLTSISLDHTVELGDTIEKIAEEKSAIIKQDCTVVSDLHADAVERIIINRCNEMNASLKITDHSLIHSKGRDDRQQYFDYGEYQDLSIPLLGDYQLHNAALVINTIEAMIKKGWQINRDAIRRGLHNVCCVGRFEIINRFPTFVVDCGHNPECAQAIVRNLTMYYPNKKFVFIIGVLADKNYKGIFDILMPHSYQFVFVTPPSLRALQGYKLLEFINRYPEPVSSVVCAKIEDGIQKATQIAGKEGVICAFGSIYTVRFIRDFFLVT